MISETDWKKFRKIKEASVERFCASVVADYTDALSNVGLSNAEKHRLLYRLAIKHDKEIARLFDDHSRSQARFQLSLLRMENLVTDADLAELSDELKSATQPIPADVGTRIPR